MKIKTFVLGIIAILFIVSCEDYLNVDQPDIIEQEQAFNDKNSTRLSLLGIYGLMTDLVEPMFLAGEVRADLAIANKSAEAYVKEYSNNSFSASNPYVSPKPFYTIINNSNDFINEFEGMLANQKMDTADFRKYKSELVAIRVWSQYQIGKIFGSCKYYTEVLNSENSSGIVNYSIEDTAFLGVLIRDLTFSDTTNFTSITEEMLWQASRFSDYYVDVLMGELLMDKGEYEEAIDKFNEVIANSRIKDRFKLNVKFVPPTDWYFSLFYYDLNIGRMKNNAVFMIAYDNRYNQSNQLWNWTLSPNYQVAPADWYVVQFQEHAITDEDFDPRYLSMIDLFAFFGRDNVINKYTDSDRPFVLTRTARVSLLKAWCLNLMGEDKKAIKEIDNIRKRIAVPKLDQDGMPSGDKKAMIWIEDAIMDELAYENGFEGQRWFDLMRVAQRRNDPSYLANKVAQKYPDESREKIRTKLLDKANWYIPVFE